MHKKTLVLTLALAMPASLTFAQRPGALPPGPPPGQQQGGEPRPPRGNRPPKDGGDRNQPERPPVPPLLEALDGDRDGIISADEMKAAPDSLKPLDKNKDGRLTPDEFLGRLPDGPPPRGPREGGDRRPADRNPGQKPDSPRDGDGKPQRPPPPLVGALDADHDGVISATEIADAAKALATLDKNGDGQLGPGEYMGRPPGDRRPDGDGPNPPRPRDQGR